MSDALRAAAEILSKQDQKIIDWTRAGFEQIKEVLDDLNERLAALEQVEEDCCASFYEDIDVPDGVIPEGADPRDHGYVDLGYIDERNE